MSDPYAWWRNALAGNFGPMHDGDAQPGFYRKRDGKNGPWFPVAIWLDQFGLPVATCAGREVNAGEIWSWCCKYPVTEDAYREVAERGMTWADDIAPLRSNNPPAGDAETDEIDSAIAAALAALGQPIATQADADRIGNHRDRLLKLHKDQDAKREAEKRPHLEAGRAVDAKFKPILARIEDAGKKLRAVLTAWLNAEAERKAAEAAALQKAAPAGVTVEAAPVKAGTAGRATALRTVKSAVITDYGKALDYFAEASEVRALIQQLADRAARAGIAVPGVEIQERKEAA
jgi:hypothetical protein